MRTFWALLRLLAPARGWMALSALLAFATIGSGIGLMATAAFIIALAALHPSVADLAVPIVGVRFFGISRGVFRYLERYVTHGVTFHLLARLRVWFYASVEPLAPARLRQYRSGDLLGRVVADVETLQHFYVRVIAPTAAAALVVVAVWFLMVTFDAALGYTTVAFLLMAGVGVPLLAQRLSAAAGRRLVAARGALNAQLVDGIQGLADLAAYGREADHLQGVRALNATLMAAQERMALVAGVHSALGGLLAHLGMWAVLLVAIPLVAGGRIEGVYLPVLALAALASFEAVAPLPLAFQYLGHCLESARRLFEIAGSGTPPEGWRASRAGDHGAGAGSPDRSRPASTHAAPGEASPRGPRAAGGLLHGAEGEGGALSPVCQAGATGDGRSRAPLRGGLVVTDLRFRYGPAEPPALDGVTFALPAGGHLAVVGPSGAGKSTLVNLLLRFWDYQEGSIVLCGRELREWDEEEARRLVAVVSQRTHLFGGTIRENLLLARPEASEEEVVRAAQRARLHDFVQTLPRRYDTWIGEQGLLLSGGERQRLAIARALLKDAPLLILDEATANLDSLTEEEVLRALRELREGRTTLTITHRLAGLADADEIVVLRAGRVVERGRHEELLAGGGLYRRLWDLQRQSLPVA